MSLETPTRPPGPPRDTATPRPTPAEVAEPKQRRIPKAALAGGAPVALSGAETIGVNYGTTGILIAGGITIGGFLLYRLRGVLLGLAGLGWLQTQRKRGHIPGPAARNGVGGVRGALGRLTGRNGTVGRTRGGGVGSSGSRRGALGRIAGKTRSALGGKRGGRLGKAPRRSGGKGGSGGPLRRAASAIGGARRSGGKRPPGSAEAAKRGRNGRPNGSRNSGTGRAPRRGAGAGNGSTTRGQLGRLAPKGRNRTGSGKGSRSRSSGGLRGLLGGKGRSASGGRKGTLGGKGRSSSGGRKGILGGKGRASSGGSGLGRKGLFGRRNNPAGRQTKSTGPNVPKPGSRPMTKKQRDTRRKRINHMSPWQTALERRNRERHEQRKTAKDALDEAQEANSGMKRVPIAPQVETTIADPPSPEPAPPSPQEKRNTNMPNPFEPVEEAMASTPAIEVENARTVMDFNEHAPEFAQQTAAFWKKNGEAIKDGLPLAPEYGEALDNLHSAMGLYAEDVAETGAVWKRAHEEKIQAIEDPLPNAHKWDIALNRE